LAPHRSTHLRADAQLRGGPPMRYPRRWVSTLAFVALLVPRSVAARPLEIATFPVGPDAYTGNLQVATGTDGTMVFEWADVPDFRTQLYSQSGAPLAPSVVVGDGLSSLIAADTRGGYLLAFTRYNPTEHAYHLFGRLLDQAGAAAGAEFQVDSPGAEGTSLF